MIRLERPTGIPAPLRSAAADEARADSDAWVSRQLTSRRSKTSLASQQPMPLRTGIIDAPEVMSALRAAQHEKCAACESMLGPSETTTRFRPASGAVGVDGVSSLPHYAWLAYDWENLHLICVACEQAKGLRFPVPGRRASPGSRGADLDAEHAALLDPFLDDPAEHLVFTTDGRVNSDTVEGRTTIDCQLNRPTLQAARAASAAEATASWDKGDRDAVVRSEHEYAGARRDAIHRTAEETAAAEPSIVDEDLHLVVGDVWIRKRTIEAEEAAVVAESAAMQAQDDYLVDDPVAAEVYFASSKYIESIEVTNWKPVSHLVLTVQPGQSERAPWLMLLGENGAGKSSILQGVALALLGEQSRDALGLRAGDFVRNGTRHAEVTVRISGVLEPSVVTARRSDDRFGGSKKPKVLILAYGATRLLPKRGAPALPPPPDAVADVDNLFDPFVPMTDANSWLLGLDDERFAAAARALRRLLGLTGTDGLMRYRRSGDVRCRVLGSVVPLNRLSDGYQSVIAVACDVMAVLLSRWTDMAAAEGIVVIDELGAHLHPRWRMRIVTGLREVFPRVQFVATTHDPLCLRGLDNGELALVQRLNDKQRTVEVRQDLPPVAGLRADQLLTSELFGLRSTVDPEIEAVFDEYYALLAVRDPTPEQTQRIAELEAQLDAVRLLGDTQRERLVYQAADRWLSEQSTSAAPAGSGVTSEAAVSMLAEVWKERSPERFEGQS